MGRFCYLSEILPGQTILVQGRWQRIVSSKDLHAEQQFWDLIGFNHYGLKSIVVESVYVNGNWTIIFRFGKNEANDVDLVDYHY